MEEQKTRNKVTCPECGSSKFTVDSESGERVCAKCGLVIFQQELLGQPQLEEVKEPEKGYAQPSLGRMKRLQFFERNLIRENRGIARNKRLVRLVVEKMALPHSFEEDALNILEKARRKSLTAGRSTEACVCALVYIAIKQRGVPRTLTEVASTLNYDTRNIRRCYSSLVEGLGLRLISSNPRKYLSRYVERLNLGTEIEGRAFEILREARRALQGKNPLALASASIYMASKEKGTRLTEKEVAGAFGVSEVSLRRRLRDIEATQAGRSWDSEKVI